MGRFQTLAISKWTLAVGSCTSGVTSFLILNACGCLLRGSHRLTATAVIVPHIRLMPQGSSTAPRAASGGGKPISEFVPGTRFPILQWSILPSLWVWTDFSMWRMLPCELLLKLMCESSIGNYGRVFALNRSSQSNALGASNSVHEQSACAYARVLFSQIHVRQQV